MRKRIIMAALVLAAPLAWTAAASALLSNLANVPYRLDLWWRCTGWWGANWWAGILIAVSAAAPTALLFALAVSAVGWHRRKQQQALYGETGWAETPEQMRRGGIQVVRKPRG